MKENQNQDQQASNERDEIVEQGKANKLTEQQKEELQVKDGQNDHHVDERGGF